MSSLPQETIVSVRDIALPTARKSLRDIVSAPYSIVRHGWLPASRTASQLIVVGRPPSLQLMNTMLALLPDGYIPGFIFNFLFQQRMPADVRGLLAAQRIKDPRELAARADEYWVVRQWNSTITSVGPVLQEEPVVHYPDDGILAVRNQSTGRKNVRSNRPRPTTENEIFWFHRKWGVKVHSFRKPCSFRAPGNGQTGRSCKVPFPPGNLTDSHLIILI